MLIVLCIILCFLFSSRRWNTRWPRDWSSAVCSSDLRPDFTIAQVVKQFEVSQSTLRRGITSGRFPNATKDHAGRWVIPVDDVLDAGYKPRKTWLNEGSHDHRHEPGSQGGHDHGQGSQNLSDANKQAVATDHG